jgi:hypothetical protein
MFINRDVAPAAMLRIVLLTVLLGLVFTVFLSTSADARRLRYYNGYERTYRNDSDSARRARNTWLPGTPIRGASNLSVVVERLISGCGQQAGELGNLLFAAIARIAAPDEVQTSALEALRETAMQAKNGSPPTARKVSPREPAVRLEAVERAIDAASAAFATVVPALQKFYSALDDEQKARLLRDMTLAHMPLPRASELRGDRASDWIGAPPLCVPMQALTKPSLRKGGTASAKTLSRRSGAGRFKRSRAA